MATFTIRYITRDGGVGKSETITNRARAISGLDAWTPEPAAFAVAILIVGSNFRERSILGDLAVADVFYSRAAALQFVNKIGEENV